MPECLGLLLCFVLLGLIGTLTHRNSDTTSGLFSLDIYKNKVKKLGQCFAWLSSWKNAPTHTIAGVQELYQQLLLTKVYYNRKTKSQVTDEKCRLCGDSLENVQHILSGCSALAQTKYLQRYNNAFKILSSTPRY